MGVYRNYQRPLEGPSIVIYLRFARIALGQWDVIHPVKSAEPIATITGRRGHLLATIAVGHTLGREELACLLDFIEDRERKRAA